MTDPIPPPAAKAPRRLVYAMVAIVTFLADQSSKVAVAHRIMPYALVPVIPHLLNFTNTENPGAAFGLMADSPAAWKTGLLVGVSALLIVGIAIMVWRSRWLDRLTGTALALILGGAVSNLADRVRYGRVVDFLDLYFRNYHWYTFNVADSAIVAGASLLIWRVFRAH